jgi:flagellar biosynthesis protein FlhG
MFQSINNAVINKNNRTAGSKKVEIISVTSGKGGVGKSTLSANMAILMQQMNHKALLIDADIHLGNIDLILGVRARYSISDVLRNGMDLQNVIVKGPGNLDILPASSASIDLITTEDALLRKLSQAFAKFQHDYDIILIDTGAGIAQTVISFLIGSDKIALVITPDPASIADAYAVIKIVRSVNMSIPIYLIPNMVSSPEEADILYRKMNLMVNKFLNSQINLGGSVIKDDLIAWSVKKQSPFVLEHPHSAPANSLRLLNRRILQPNGDSKGLQNNIFDRLISNKKIQYEWNL